VELVGDLSAYPTDPTDAIESGRAAIVALYGCALRRADSALCRDPDALGQALHHAGLVLDDVISSLRSGVVFFDVTSTGLAAEIGVTRAAHKVHPSESLAAAVLLFDVIFTEIGALIGEHPESAKTLSLAARVLHRSLTERVRIASESYTSYLLSQVHGALLDERRRIARDLHDRVGAGISAASRHLELFEMYHHREPARAFARVSTAQEALRDTMDEVRELTSDLSLRMPQGGLEKALTTFIKAASSKGTSRVAVYGDESWAPEKIRAELFLIVREAIRNSFAHAEPKAVAARIDIAPHEVRAVVTDDGCGFDLGVDRLGGSGLASMEERARLLGGSVTVSSWLGRGSRVEVLIPLEEAAHGGR
jgi:signal transduction histidine kinase